MHPVVDLVLNRVVERQVIVIRISDSNLWNFAIFGM